MKQLCLLLVTLACFGLPGLAASGEVSDAYLTGYARAVLDRELGLQEATIQADSGTLLIGLSEANVDKRTAIRSALSDLPDAVQLRIGPKAMLTAAASGTSPSPGEHPPPETEILPDQPLFEPLMADPRWPHFSASYQRYLDQDDLENVGHTSFGESFVFYRNNGGIRWEFGLQAGVFALFDLDADSYDLINADYRVSLPVSARWQALSGTFRILHQSSHLGDEFLLRGRAEDRENLSYEKVDGLLSLDLPFGSRLYGGGGYLVHKNPSDLEPWSAQGGLEWVCPTGFADGLLFPVAAVDIQSEEENDWDLDVSAKAGLQLGQRGRENSSRLQLTLEYYQGHSPNGQFYNELIESIGLGLHYYR